MSEQTRHVIRDKLQFLYGPEEGARCYQRLAERLERFRSRHHRPTSPRSDYLTERDVVLITYGDQLREPDHKPLVTLTNFLTTRLKGVINTVHILPFFPYSSDDGFSVIDYRRVNPELGTWEDIHRLKRSFKLMVDAVLNHVSTQSEWFQGFLRGDEKYREYFITVDPSTDLSMVVRPRDLPLLTPVETSWGTQYVWTTFSRDQIDLNYHNPDVLLEMIDILLFYIEQGADIIRLDAIAYLWKEIGTTCIHLPQTHAVVQLFRAIVDEVAPGVLLITETNVPHAENISYFGDGTNEAHLVYQFPLPPLVAHAFMRGTARHLTEWAAGLEAPSEQTSFFNFTASHDGVGVRPLAGLLGEEELEALIEQTHASGGQVSYKLNPDGSKSPYELNVTYFDLLNPPGRGESLSLQVRRFLASQAIMLALAGMPGIYFHSLLGSRNYLEGVKKTGYPRTINREKLDVREVEAALADPRSLRHAVFTGYRSLLQKRIAEKAFHPNAEQRVLSLNEAVFSLLRVAPSGEEAIIALHNVSATGQPITINLHELGLTIPAGHLRDIVSGATWAVEQPASFAFELEPYQVAWLKVLP